MKSGRGLIKKGLVTPRTIHNHLISPRTVHHNNRSAVTSRANSARSVDSTDPHDLHDLRGNMRRVTNYVINQQKDSSKLSIHSLAAYVSQLSMPQQSNYRSPQSNNDTISNTVTPSLTTRLGEGESRRTSQDSSQDSSQIASQIVALPRRLKSHDDHDDHDDDCSSIGDSEYLSHSASPTAVMLKSGSYHGHGLLSPSALSVSSLKSSFISPTVNRSSVLSRGYGSHNELDSMVTEQRNLSPIQQRRASASPLSLSPLKLPPFRVNAVPALLGKSGGGGGSATKAGERERAGSIDMGSGRDKLGNNINDKHHHRVAGQPNVTTPVKYDRASQSNVTTSVKSDRTSPSPTSIKSIIAESRKEQNSNTNTTTTTTTRPGTTSTAQIPRSRSHPMLLLPLFDETKEKQRGGGSMISTSARASSSSPLRSSSSVLASQSCKTTRETTKTKTKISQSNPTAPNRISQSNLTAPSQISLSSKAKSSLDGSQHGSHHGSLDRSQHGSLDRSHHGTLDRSQHGSLDRSQHGSLDRSHHGSLDRSQHGTLDRSHHGSLDRSHHGTQRVSHVRVPTSTSLPHGDDVTPSRSHVMMKGLRNGRSLSQVPPLLELVTYIPLYTSNSTLLYTSNILIPLLYIFFYLKNEYLAY